LSVPWCKKALYKYSSFPFLFPKKGHSSPHFSAHVYCGETAEWIKTPLGTEVGMGTELSPQKGAQQLPNFRPMSTVARRLD